MRVLLIALVLLLTACGGRNAKPNLPQCAIVPELQVVERHAYVRIPADLVKPEPIAEGPLSECPVVARERRAALERANSKLKQIGGIQGTEAKP